MRIYRRCPISGLYTKIYEFTRNTKRSTDDKDSDYESVGCTGEGETRKKADESAKHETRAAAKSTPAAQASATSGPSVDASLASTSKTAGNFGVKGK